MNLDNWEKFFARVKKKIKRGVKRIKTWIKQKPSRAIAYAVWAFAIFFVVNVTLAEMAKPETVTYAQFRKDLEAGNIDCVYYKADEETMRYTLHNDETRDMDVEALKDYTHPDEDWRMTTYPAGEDFRKEMLEHGVRVTIKDFDPLAVTLFGTMLTLAIPLAFFILIWRALNGQLGSIKIDDAVVTSDVKFSDVIGHDEVIEDLRLIVALMKDSSAGVKFNAEIPRGMLFTGEPGTGKTLLAKAVAGESGVPFLYFNASSFIELYVGTGARRVRELFDKARELAPCILFLDEIDAVGRKRDTWGTHSEDRQTINALLQEMDGFSGSSGVFVIAATNDAACLDNALVRAGRFDRQIVVRPPKDWTVRRDLFDYYIGDIPSTVDVERISKQTVGFTGADISAIVNEAKLIAIHKESDVLDDDCVEEAIDRKIFKGNRVRHEQRSRDIEVVAYHEAGHAVMNFICGMPIARASIIGNTSGVGGMVIPQERSSQFMTRKDIAQQVMVQFAGRISERIKFGAENETTGAANDITQATELIESYVKRLGFDSKVGMLDIKSMEKNNVNFNTEAFTALMSTFARNAEEKAESLLSANYCLVEALAQELLRKETLSGAEIQQLLENVRGV